MYLSEKMALFPDLIYKIYHLLITVKAINISHSTRLNDTRFIARASRHEMGVKNRGREDLEEMCHLMEASVMIREKIHVGYTRLKCVV